MYFDQYVSLFWKSGLSFEFLTVPRKNMNTYIYQSMWHHIRKDILLIQEMSNSPATQQRGCGIFYGAIPSALTHTHTHTHTNTNTSTLIHISHLDGYKYTKYISKTFMKIQALLIIKMESGD
jgi:hypothetical protein